MLLFIIINILYIVLPFGFAAIHNKINKQHIPFVRLTFAYFLLFDVFLKAMPVAIAAIFQGNAMAIENGWAFSPMYAQYGVAIGAMGLMGLVALFIRGIFRVAVGFTFALFLLFSAIAHIIQVVHGFEFVTPDIATLIASNLITAILLFYFSFNIQARG